VGPRWNAEAKRACLCSPGTLKTFVNLWERRKGDFHKIINKWGGELVASASGEVSP
jgi:hypothetical protein